MVYPNWYDENINCSTRIEDNNDLKSSKKKGNFLRTRLTFRLLEKVGTKGLKYFGKDVRNANKQRTSIFICYHCNETFRAILSQVNKDKITHCGCQKRKK